MPWESVAQLKTSDAYKKSNALKAMSQRQLQRFIDVHAAVFSRIMENGGEDEQAERTAFAIAFSTARRANASLDRKLEREMHFFAAMAPAQFGNLEGHLMDFAWINEHPDLANLVVAGNEFNWDHDRTHGLGQIRGLILRKDAPPKVQKATHRDIPFLFVASYYEDADDDVKGIDTISAEWASLGENDGVEVPLPLSFAITKEPQNDPTSGIQRIASWSPKSKDFEAFVASLRPERVMSDASRYKEARATMPPTKKPDTEQESDLSEMVASLQKDLEGYGNLKESFAALQKTVANIEGLKPLAEAIASLQAKPEDAQTVIKTVEASLKRLADEGKTNRETIAGLQTQITGLTTERATEKAGEFAASLVKARKIPADATEKWASLHLKDAKMAVELAASLGEAFLGESEAQAKGGKKGGALPEEMASLLAEIDPRLKKEVKA